MGLLVSNPDVSKPCDCGTSKCQIAFTYSTIKQSGNPYITRFYPSDPNGAPGNETEINQYGCCDNLWQMWAWDNQVYPGKPLMNVTYNCQWHENLIGNFIFTVSWGDGSQQETIYQETWTGIQFIHAGPAGGTNDVTLIFQDPNWVRYPAHDGVFLAYRWVCPNTVGVKDQPHVYYSLQLTGLPSDVPPLTIAFWPVGNLNTGVTFPNLEFYTCPGTQPCVDVSSVGTPTGGDECLTQWSETEVPQRGLVQPGNCPIKCYFTSAGIKSGTFAGFTIEELYSRVLGTFTYSYTLTLDGIALISQSATLQFPNSSTADIVFAQGGWYVWGNVFRSDYNGPISANPTIMQTFSLNQQRCLYRPKFCITGFQSTV